MPPFVLLESYRPDLSPGSYRFDGFIESAEAGSPAEVAPTLDAVQRAVAGGLHAAGFVLYEAAAGLDSLLVTRHVADRPLVWFGLFRERIPVEPGRLPVAGDATAFPWRPSIRREDYAAAFRTVKSYIRRGDTYQVNLTYRLDGRILGDLGAFYRRLCRNQRAPYCGFIDTGRHVVLSASPELFFSLRDGWLEMRPMKGTRPRGRWEAEDEALVRDLCSSEKERAENLMIVDLLRNDAGKIAETGSVTVPRLWAVERYDTVLQLTSSVRARLRPSTTIAEVFRALFPCGSVTGAPKRRTMEIIAELEPRARGIYTGAIGFVSPSPSPDGSPEACFNVAIRTVWCESKTGEAEFGVGGGIVHDSDVDMEYAETQTKAAFLVKPVHDFDLLETLAWDPEEGYRLLDRHLRRMERSALRFGFPINQDVLNSRLQEASSRFCVPMLVRLTLSSTGRVDMTAQPLEPAGGWSVHLSPDPVDSGDPLLFHKTTRRDPYDRRLQPGFDDVILVNERGELTECGKGNLVLVMDGRAFTPPLASGLLPGTFREQLLERSDIVERVLYPDDLVHAQQVFLINSVRGWVPLSTAGIFKAADGGGTVE